MKRFLLFTIMCVCVSIGAWAHPIPGGGEVTVDGTVATFHNVTAGMINDHWNPISNHLNGATRIKFDNTCAINQADLLKFLGTQNATYYVDLFDITNGDNAKMTPETIDPIITGAVDAMASNGWQAKGIILPLNTISGTSTVEKSSDVNNPKPTFTEYAAYYRNNTTQKTATIYAHDTGMSGDNWQNMSNNTEAQNHYNTAYAHLSSHSEVAQAETYIVSTNNKIKNSDEGLNVSNLPASATKITIINDEMVYTGNPRRTYLADIIVEGTEGAFAAAVANTNIKKTPCEELIFKGAVNSNDIAAINSFTEADGPYVYNLVEATGVAKTDLSSITNTKVEYIILPHAMAEVQIEKDCFSESLTNSTTFKAAIAASTDKKKMSAYVNVAGSLAKARCYATGNGADQAGQYKPAKQGLTSVILGGNLNASDISTKQENNKGLQDEATTITSLDLEKAYFANVNDMRLGNSGQVQIDGQWVTMDGAGFQQSSVLTEVKLPSDPRMTEIPEGCLNGIKCLRNLHIPYNYEKIGWVAFWETGINHITTEDASHALIDNGPNTYTLSANIKELGKPGQGEGNAVFPGNQFVTDVYCLAMTTPVCYAHTFHANMVYANGGIYGGVYCREKYIDGTSNAVTMLHFPSQESYVNAKGNDTGYNDMVAKYTDPTRVYSKKDQTGAVDANGNSLLWPDQGEVLYTRGMALDGYIWTNYQNKQYETGGDGHLSSMGPATGAQAAFYPNYVGWHEFVLSVATYVDPDEIVEDEKIIREYEEAGWYTFCIPFNMTYDQVVEMLGVPRSTDKVINKLNGVVVEDEDIMPDIRQLSGVTRKKGTGSQSNIVFLRLTRNLYDKSTGHTNYLEFNNDATPQTITPSDAQPYNQNYSMGTQRCLVGGRPYVIKAYKRKKINDKGVDEYKIKGQNIARAILTRYADQFGAAASCVMNGLYEQLGNGDLLTLRFAKPYEEHKVQAVRDGENSAYLTYEVDNDGNVKTYKYYYTMIGQFWQQDLPQYCLYMSRGNWYRYTDTSLGYKWDPYKCVILPTQEIDNGKGGKFRDEDASVYPEVVAGTTDKLIDTFSLTFLDGRDDDDFDGNGTSAKYMFVLDDDIVEIDDEGNVVNTIKQLDGEMVSVPVNAKVYNMAGQYVGNSLQGLSKGMYVVNGKKYIVK